MLWRTRTRTRTRRRHSLPEKRHERASKDDNSNSGNRKWRRQQYNLVADEIERVLNDEGPLEDEDGHDDEGRSQRLCNEDYRRHSSSAPSTAGTTATCATATCATTAFSSLNTSKHLRLLASTRRRLSLQGLRRRASSSSIGATTTTPTTTTTSTTSTSTSTTTTTTTTASGLPLPFEESNNTTTTTTTSSNANNNTNNNNPRRRKRRMITTTESDINAYTLFDAAGSDANTATADERSSAFHQDHHQDHPSQSQSQNYHASRINYHTSSKSKSKSKNSNVIYTKDYHPSAFFTPILLFLTVTFFVLVVIRILVSLLTMAVGVIVLVLMVLRVLQEFWWRPLGLLRRLHASPIRSFLCLGALWGVIWSALWTLYHQHHYYTTNIVVDGIMSRILLGALASSLDPSATTSLPLSSLESNYNYNNNNNNNNTVTRQDMAMFWGLLEGAVLGIQIGALWLVVLGDASDPSIVTKWIHRHFWRHAQRYYRDSLRVRARQRQQQQQEEQIARIVANQASSPNHDDADADIDIDIDIDIDDDDQKRRMVSDDHRQCMICLDSFQKNKNKKHHQQQRRSLPCLHGFHGHCLQDWLAIKPTCPICRIPIDEEDIISITAFLLGTAAEAHPPSPSPSPCPGPGPCPLHNTDTTRPRISTNGLQ